jgi:hypothetical protein
MVTDKGVHSSGPWVHLRRLGDVDTRGANVGMLGERTRGLKRRQSDVFERERQGSEKIAAHQLVIRVVLLVVVVARVACARALLRAGEKDVDVRVKGDENYSTNNASSAISRDWRARCSRLACPLASRESSCLRF